MKTCHTNNEHINGNQLETIIEATDDFIDKLVSQFDDASLAPNQSVFFSQFSVSELGTVIDSIPITSYKLRNYEVCFSSLHKTF